MGMEGAELGVVEAKETRKMLEGARPCRQFLQALVWRHQGSLEDAGTNTIQTHQTLHLP
ncbi:hypothetical protein GBA52_013614 [Prunus armeniaca]|nr:hypothetical protein GBA52_013614 [Prunus armeniaca]